MASTGFSGAGGSVNGVTEITNWSLTKTSNNPAYASGATDGVKTRKPGVKDSNGSVQFKLPGSGALPYDEGEEVTLQLATGTGAPGWASPVTGHTFNVPAIIDQIQLEVDVDNGEIVGGSFDFSGTGAIT